jgi:hypothetical protein
VSFILTQRATVGPPNARRDRSGDFWIVDVWRQVGGKWLVAARYSGKVETQALPPVLPSPNSKPVKQD